MRHILVLAATSLLAGCASSCAIARGLYSAVVQRSGAPPREELRAYRGRDSTIGRELSSLRVVVLPVSVIGRTPHADSQAAERLATTLAGRHVVASASVGEEAGLPFEPHPNELMIFWTRFRALQAQVRAHPPRGADLVLQVDVFGRPERGLVGAVHVMGVRADGTLTYGSFWNSHQELFREVQPKSVDDAVRMVVLDAERRRARHALR